MYRSSVSQVITATILGFLVATAAANPAAAATTGTLCGRVTAFTAPTLTTNGSITINGRTDVIDSAATASIGSALAARLAAMASAKGTTCLNVSAGTGGVIVALSLATSARICGLVTLAADGSATVGGVAVAPSVLNANAAAALRLAATARLSACVDLALNSSGTVTSAAVTVSFDQCGAVVLNANGDIAINGVVVPGQLFGAGAKAVLLLAARTDGQACVSIRTMSSNGQTTVQAIATANVCASVTAVTASTITLGGVSVEVGGAGAAQVRVGQRVCVQVVPRGNGVRGTLLGNGRPPSSSGGSGPALSNTAVRADPPTTALGLTLLLAALVTAAVLKLRRSA